MRVPRGVADRRTRNRPGKTQLRLLSWRYLTVLAITRSTTNLATGLGILLSLGRTSPAAVDHAGLLQSIHDMPRQGPPRSRGPVPPTTPMPYPSTASRPAGRPASSSPLEETSRRSGPSTRQRPLCLHVDALMRIRP